MSITSFLRLLFLSFNLFLSELSPLLQSTINLAPVEPHEVVPIPFEFYKHLYRYAHLLDIAYCIDSVQQIQPPFQCDLNCAQLFPYMFLVYQWHFDNSVSGYIAKTNHSLFGEDEKSVGTFHNYTVVMSLRGTRSVTDTMADLKFDMTTYHSHGNAISACGPHCRVHAGFYEYFQKTLNVVHPYITSEVRKGGPETQLVIVGHSLGGAVGLFLALYYLSLGFPHVRLITMGQPLVGNREFVQWADWVMGSRHPVNECSDLRKWSRVVHRNDLVTTIPQGSYFGRYQQFDNQIYVNCSATNAKPRFDQVMDCGSGSNPQCIAGDVLRSRLTNDYLLSHNTYFRHLGLCGIHIDQSKHSLA